MLDYKSCQVHEEFPMPSIFSYHFYKSVGTNTFISHPILLGKTFYHVSESSFESWGCLRGRTNCPQVALTDWAPHIQNTRWDLSKGVLWSFPDPSPIIGYACHWLTDWLINWLTHSCLVSLIDVTLAWEDANSKLVDVVTVVDEDRVVDFEAEVWSKS